MGRRSLPDVLREEVMEPIGARPRGAGRVRDSGVEVDGKRVQSVSGGGTGRRHVINSYDMRASATCSCATQLKDRASSPRVDSDGADAGEPTTRLRLRKLVSEHDRKPLPAAPETAVRFRRERSNIITSTGRTTSSTSSAGSGAIAR